MCNNTQWGYGSGVRGEILGDIPKQILYVVMHSSLPGNVYIEALLAAYL